MPTTYTPSSAVQQTTYATPVTKTVNLDSDIFLMRRDYRDAIIADWEDDDFLSFLEFPGDGLLSVASSFYHYEKPLLIRSVKLGALSGVATAAQVSFTLDPTAYIASGDGDRTALKKDDIIEIRGNVFARIDIKSGTGTATIFTASRRQGTTDDIGAAITAAIAAGDDVTIPFDAHAEGTDFPDEGLVTLPSRFTGQFQHIKSYQAITGDAASHKAEATFNGTQYVWDWLLVDQLKRHRIKQKMAFMFSPEGNFLENGQPVPLTSSLRGTLRVFGNRLLYDGTTGFTLADLDLMINQVKTRVGAKKMYLFCGPTLRAQIETILQSFGNGGGIHYDTWGGDANGRNKMISLGFSGFERHNVQIIFQEYRLLTALTGQPWQTYDREGYLVPADRATVQETTMSGIQSLTLDTLTLRYKKQGNGISRRFREVNRDVEVTFNDKIEKGIMTQEGLEINRRRLCFYIAPQ